MTLSDSQKLELEAVKKMLQLGAGEICPELVSIVDLSVSVIKR